MFSDTMLNTNTTTSNPAAMATHSSAASGSASSGLSTGSKIGIGAGVTLGALAVIGLLCFVLLRKRKKSNYNAVTQSRGHFSPTGRDDSRATWISRIEHRCQLQTQLQKFETDGRQRDPADVPAVYWRPESTSDDGSIPTSKLKHLL